MTQDVSRRNFVAAAGIGLALAACSESDKTAPKPDSGNFPSAKNAEDAKELLARNSGVKMLVDPNLNHGRLPTLTPTTTKGTDGKPQNGLPFSEKEFTPEHIAIIAIHFSDKGIRSSQHWFKDVLKKGGAATKDEKAFVNEKLKTIRKNLPNTTIGDKKEQSFKKFVFGSQHKVYIYVVNPTFKLFSPLPVSFAAKSGDVFGPDGIGIARDENSSFFEAKVLTNWIDGTADDANADGYNTSIIYLANWFMDKNGTPLTKKSEMMNSLHVHTLQPTGEPGEFKIVSLDPDTGNGWGGTP